MIHFEMDRSNLDWLLEEENPSVRYLALRNVIGFDENLQSVTDAKNQIMQKGAVSAILSKQKSEGYWESLGDFYIRTKYRGTVWTLILLAEMCADGKDARIRNACEIIFERSQDGSSGGFAYRESKEGRGGDHARILPCLTGNMLSCFIRFGYLEDPRVKKGIEWITRYMRFDDGEGKGPDGWPYDVSDKCWGRHTCYLGLVKCLKALSEIPVERRSQDVQVTIDRCIDFILKHGIYRKSHHPSQLANPRWISFGFPLMWDTDVIEILHLLNREGVWDSRMEAAFELVLSKRTKKNVWLLDKSFNGRMQVRIEKEGAPSKWVTLRALIVLKKAHFHTGSGSGSP